MGGHTLSGSAPDACILVEPSGAISGTVFSIQNVVIQNGAVISSTAECVYLVGGTACIVDHGTMITKAQCAFLDVEGANRISNCIFISQNQSANAGPILKYGPAQSTVFLMACSDLVENNVVTGPATPGPGALMSIVTASGRLGIGPVTVAIRRKFRRVPSRNSNGRPIWVTCLLLGLLPTVRRRNSCLTKVQRNANG